MSLAKRRRQLLNLQEDVGELLDRQEGEDRDFSSYENDPVGFVREVLDGDPWERQVEIAEAVREHPQVTVRSCHASGKDWAAARLALWWCYARDGLVVLTGPTAAQVEEILMRKEIHDAFIGANLPGQLHVRALRPHGSGRAGILARTSKGVSGLTGFHDTRVLYVITEAQDAEVSDAWDAAFAVTTGSEDRILTLGNPTRTGTRFHRAHQSPEWKSLKIAAEDIPNVQEGRDVVRGLLTRDGVDRFASEYGENSGFYTSRVEAEFPSSASDAVLPRELLEEAVGRELDQDDPAYHLGVDVARFGGDRTVFALFRGKLLLSLEGHQGIDTARTAEIVCEFLDEADRVFIDATGVGAGVVDAVEDRGPWAATIRGVKVGASADESDRFARKRSEMWWRLRKDLEEGLVGIRPRALGTEPQELIEELSSVRYKFDSRSRLSLESKDELRGRLGRSPDVADAVVLAHAAADTAPAFDDIWVPGER